MLVVAVVVVAVVAKPSVKPVVFLAIAQAAFAGVANLKLVAVVVVVATAAAAVVATVVVVVVVVVAAAAVAVAFAVVAELHEGDVATSGVTTCVDVGG